MDKHRRELGHKQGQDNNCRHNPALKKSVGCKSAHSHLGKNDDDHDDGGHGDDDGGDYDVDATCLLQQASESSMQNLAVLQ
ncbi:hypothetical protein [Nitrosomonas marina]|uniref:hypothetical protein n=1 Tax=Nitrosomonas marina TaxID=917 RepID=UPI0015A51557|nr:hypothetical protein [Nitrosomonas marina]